ncbi:MAG: twin-arginine translocase subunit TatC, partial [Deltaproteobacteria bacterium]
MQEEKLPITEHLEELRTRLIRAFIALGITSAGCYLFAEKILTFLLK